MRAAGGLTVAPVPSSRIADSGITALAVTVPPVLTREKWKIPKEDASDRDRNDTELRVLLRFLNNSNTTLVQTLLREFGEFIPAGTVLTNEELETVPIKGRLRNLNEIWLQKG